MFSPRWPFSARAFLLSFSIVFEIIYVTNWMGIHIQREQKKPIIVKYPRLNIF